MEKDIDDIKPRKWLVVILILVALSISVILINKIVTDRKENSKKDNNIFNIFNGFEGIESSFKKDSFNSNFEFYMGSKSGNSLNNLIDEIITNNKKNKNHLVTVVYKEINTTDSEIIKTIKDNIKTFDKYEISLDYDDKGFVNKITVELKEKDMSEVREFNLSYEMYTGTEYGTSVKNLIDKVITNNKTNSNRTLTIIYKDTNTSDVETIKNLKQKLDDWTKYEVSLNYDEEGFINQIVIE